MTAAERRARPRAAALAAALSLLLTLSLPVGASASPETLKRSVSNILFSPIDFVLSPFVAMKTIYTNMQDVDDSLGVRIVYPLPGLAWNSGVQFGAATIRMMAGLIELLPGLGLFFFETDMDPLFDPAERADAFVDLDTPPLYVKFGINYTVVPY